MVIITMIDEGKTFASSNKCSKLCSFVPILKCTKVEVLEGQLKSSGTDG